MKALLPMIRSSVATLPLGSENTLQSATALGSLLSAREKLVLHESDDSAHSTLITWYLQRTADPADCLFRKEFAEQVAILKNLVTWVIRHKNKAEAGHDQSGQEGTRRLRVSAQFV